MSLFTGFDAVKATETSLHDKIVKQLQQQQHHSLRSRSIESSASNKEQEQIMLEHEDQRRELQQQYPKTIFGECMAGSCSTDDDCETGLTCAATNQTVLKQNGLDTTKAYCDQEEAGSPTENSCYRSSMLLNKRCYRNIAPKPLDSCPTNITARQCDVGPVICCRTLKRIDRNGKKICNPRTCTYSRSCSCSDTQSWACKFHDPQNCETDCFN